LVKKKLFQGKKRGKKLLKVCPDNLHPGVLKIIVKVTLTIDLIGSSVLFLFPVFELFERAIWSPQQLVLFRVQILRNVLRTAIVGAACGVAVGVRCRFFCFCFLV
jgi:hypothetical protein